MRAAIACLILVTVGHAADVPLHRTHVRRLDVSSTSDAQQKGKAIYDVSHLRDGVDWSAWGSSPVETDGAWVQIQFDTVRYVSRVEFVPGHAKNAATFRQCSRPAALTVSAGGETHRFELVDERWKQSLAFDPPLAGHSLRITVDAVHGERGHAGVCVSELRLMAPADPTALIPELPSRLEIAMSLLADDGRAPHGRRDLLAIGPPAVAAVQAGLDPANPNLAARSAEVLGALGDRRAIPALRGLAAHRDAQIRSAALWALGALGSAEHVDAVRAWYDAAAGKDRDRAFDALARSGDPRALEVVVAELVDGSAARRESAAAHLGRFGADAVAALEPLIASNVRKERASALDALGSVDHPHADTLLREGLADRDSDAQAAAVRGLARRGGADAHARIATLWSSRYTDVRRAVAGALGGFGDPDDLEVLELLTADGSMSVRSAAARSLGALGKPARRTLRNLSLLGPDGATASQAAIGLLDQVRDADTAVDLLRSRHAEVRDLAAGSLDAHGARGLLALVSAVAGEDDRVRGPAATRLRQMGAVVVPDLLIAARDAPPAALPEVLGLLAASGEPMAVPFAARMALDGGDLTIRVAAVRALQKCATADQAMETLVDALDDEAQEVRVAAIDALGVLAVPQATALLLDRLEDADRPTRRASARALGRIRQRSALKPLVDAYQHSSAREDDPALREDLVVAIGRIGGRASLKVLIEAVSDTDARVSRAAAHALQ